MSKLGLIIKREYLTKVRNRTFIIMTFVSPMIFIGVAVLIGWLTNLNREDSRTVAILDETGASYVDLFEDYSNFKFVRVDNQIDQAITATKEAGYYGLIHIYGVDNEVENLTFYSKDNPSSGFIERIENAINKKATEYKLLENNIQPSILQAATVKKQLQLQTFDGDTTSKEAGWIKIAAGGAAGYLLMMFIIIYGNMLMRSVIEEKTNRIVEIIVSSVKPIYLMLGKITGTSLAGITQFLIWVVLGGTLAIVLSVVLGPDSLQNPANEQLVNQVQTASEAQAFVNDILKLPIGQLIFLFFVYFIGGYFLYASIYTAIGAAVDSETDTQQFMLPIILPLMLSIYVGFFSVIDNPHGTVAVTFSYIPLTSPIVMLMRIPFGEITWWEILISVSLLYASIIGVTYIAAKIYRVGILMYGKKTSWKQLYKWLKY
ncbi:ABC transporter permease [Nonlabens sp. SCSIO 43208]|uniref:ABC transporter permease n=1 Tax=Nonlabens sp. SCSIO 43208 TaxID=2793009 RepID=UPI003D6BD017